MRVSEIRGINLNHPCKIEWSILVHLMLSLDMCPLYICIHFIKLIWIFIDVHFYYSRNKKRKEWNAYLESPKQCKYIFVDHPSFYSKWYSIYIDPILKSIRTWIQTSSGIYIVVPHFCPARYIVRAIATINECWASSNIRITAGISQALINPLEEGRGLKKRKLTI